MTVLVAIFPLTVGCGSANDQRAAVTGSVRFDGVPLAEGEIGFVPQEKGDFMANGLIADGRYSISEEIGPSPGKYSVRIKSYRETGPLLPPGKFAGPDAKPSRIRDQFLPDKYNRKTTLTREIRAGEDNNCDFDLSSKSNN